MNKRFLFLLVSGTFLGILIVIIFYLKFGGFVSVFIALMLIALVEVAFRILYKKKTGHSWVMIPKVPFHEIYVEPHPYLPYINKRNFVTPKETAATYPLHADKKFLFGQYRTNGLICKRPGWK